MHVGRRLIRIVDRNNCNPSIDRAKEKTEYLLYLIVYSDISTLFFLCAIFLLAGSYLVGIELRLGNERAREKNP